MQYLFSPDVSSIQMQSLQDELAQQLHDNNLIRQKTFDQIQRIQKITAQERQYYLNKINELQQIGDNIMKKIKGLKFIRIKNQELKKIRKDFCKNNKQKKRSKSICIFNKNNLKKHDKSFNNQILLKVQDKNGFDFVFGYQEYKKNHSLEKSMQHKLKIQLKNNKSKLKLENILKDINSQKSNQFYQTSYSSKISSIKNFEIPLNSLISLEEQNNQKISSRQTNKNIQQYNDKTIKYHSKQLSQSVLTNRIKRYIDEKSQKNENKRNFRFLDNQRINYQKYSTGKQIKIEQKLKQFDNISQLKKTDKEDQMFLTQIQDIQPYICYLENFDLCRLTVLRKILVYDQLIVQRYRRLNYQQLARQNKKIQTNKICPHQQSSINCCQYYFLKLNKTKNIDMKVLTEVNWNSLLFLDLSLCYLQDLDVQILIQSIQKFQNLLSVSLSENKITSHGFKILIQKVSLIKNLQKIKLNKNKIQDVTAKDLQEIKSISNEKSIQSSSNKAPILQIDLKHNPLSYESKLFIKEFVRKEPKIKIYIYKSQKGNIFIDTRIYRVDFNNKKKIQ